MATPIIINRHNSSIPTDLKPGEFYVVDSSENYGIYTVIDGKYVRYTPIIANTTTTVEDNYTVSFDNMPSDPKLPGTSYVYYVKNENTDKSIRVVYTTGGEEKNISVPANSICELRAYNTASLGMVVTATISGVDLSTVISDATQDMATETWVKSNYYDKDTMDGSLASKADDNSVIKAIDVHDGESVLPGENGHIKFADGDIQAEKTSEDEIKFNISESGKIASKTYVDTAIQNIDKGLFVVVEELPDEPEEGNEYKIHLVQMRDESGKIDNLFEEYLWVTADNSEDLESDHWEKLGEFQAEIETVDKLSDDDIDEIYNNVYND